MPPGFPIALCTYPFVRSADSLEHSRIIHLTCVQPKPPFLKEESVFVFCTGVHRIHRTPSSPLNKFPFLYYPFSPVYPTHAINQSPFKKRRLDLTPNIFLILPTTPHTLNHCLRLLHINAPCLGNDLRQQDTHLARHVCRIATDVEIGFVVL